MFKNVYLFIFIYDIICLSIYQSNNTDLFHKSNMIHDSAAYTQYKISKLLNRLRNSDNSRHIMWICVIHDVMYFLSLFFICIYLLLLLLFISFILTQFFISGKNKVTVWFQIQTILCMYTVENCWIDSVDHTAI